MSQWQRLRSSFDNPVFSAPNSSATGPLVSSFRIVLAPDSKRVVSFLRRNVASVPPLPIELGQARILDVVQREVFAAYTPNDNGPEFMRLIEGTFGREITTRTWETVRKCAAA